jgi:hypothetical protein
MMKRNHGDVGSYMKTLLCDTKNAAVVIRKTPPWKAALPWGDDLFWGLSQDRFNAVNLK